MKQEETCQERVPADVVVAGHICLDIITSFSGPSNELESLLQPGVLTMVGPTVASTGGAVSNTGIALHKLGVATQLVGKVGKDPLGAAILDVLRCEDSALAEGMTVKGDEQSSYTFVLSSPGTDRSFLHCPGANSTFGACDIDYDEIAGARLFHFGYPPLMRRTYENGGEELERIFRRAKQRGLTTSLDMAYVDPNSEAAGVDWKTILERVLPYVDVFLPSLDEILFMIDRQDPAKTLLSSSDKDNHSGGVDGPMLSDIAGQLLAMGAAIVVLKLGDQGLYLRTTTQLERFQALGRGKPRDSEAWLGREILSPCFLVDVMGTTGSGDCTIAGFHAGLLCGQAPEDAVSSAAAVGACNVERSDAVSGIRPWAAVQERIRSGWKRRPVATALPDWQQHPDTGLWTGPHDAGSHDL